MKLLFAVQGFAQGMGGGPESVRLMANQLRGLGISADVFDAGGVRRDVGQLSVLPRRGTPSEPFALQTVTDYSAILQVGPWQNPLHMARLIARRRPDQALYYLPRGGLGRVEFGRAKDIKKVPYLFLVERRFINAADGVILSSDIEQREAVNLARSRTPEHVIPDFVSPRPVRDPARRGAGAVTTFSFLAEINPRKGLHLLVEAFVLWATERGIEGRVRLVVGGAARPGCKTYLAAIHAMQRRHAGRVAIEFRGPVPHGDRTAFYDETDVMVIASSFESFGLTVIEALNEGCVVLSTPDIGALQYLRANDGVVRMTGIEVADMVDGLDRALSAATGRSEAQRRARQAFAGKAVSAINAAALEGWGRLLEVRS